MQRKFVPIEADSQAQELYQRSFDLEENGHLRLALEERKRLVAYDEKNPFFRAVLARSYADNGMLLDAEREIKLAIQQKPEVEAFSLIYFNLLWESGRTDEGFDEMRRFQKYGGSPVYREMVRKINGK